MTQEPKPAEVIAEARKAAKQYGSSLSLGAKEVVRAYFDAWNTAKGPLANRSLSALTKMTGDRGNMTSREMKELEERCGIAQKFIDDAIRQLSK